ncbi:LysR family transcriptional regulator [Crenobacter sp. SG2305]|uniref:LysR family transcriptional regulator n=1 Tax=Crenobacter oryzisoli TaxID=3056844 RepID=UPI0025AA3F11|nr:LysR family transcriptional regulator [Crenobacter sp. SG2305]MDN0084548.1 LysR family transcriptional regulator [Crenobacter sp. SG2305]
MSAAAQWLHVSQPAVTKALQQAEQQLGFRLFDRVKGRLYPAPEATELYAEVEKLNANVQSMRRLATNLRGGVAERVKVVATPAPAACLVRPGDPAYPRDRRGVADARGGCRLHLAAARPSRYRQWVLARAELVVIAPAASEPMTIAEFDGAPTVGFPETDHIGRLFADACAQHGVTPAVTTCVQTFQIARELVAQGGGLRWSTRLPRACRVGPASSQGR